MHAGGHAPDQDPLERDGCGGQRERVGQEAQDERKQEAQEARARARPPEHLQPVRDAAQRGLPQAGCAALSVAVDRRCDWRQEAADAAPCRARDTS